MKRHKLVALKTLEGHAADLGRPEALPPLEPASPRTFAYTFVPGEAWGVYHLVAALVPKGAFADGRIDDGDILAMDGQAFTVLP